MANTVQAATVTVTPAFPALIPAEGGTYTITITTTAANEQWTVQRNREWITISSATGRLATVGAQATVTVTVLPTTIPDMREGRITVGY